MWGLNSQILRWPPEPKPRVGCSTDWATQAPLSFWFLISAQVMISQFREFEPHVRLCADCAGPAWDSLSPSLSLSLSLNIKKRKKKKNKRKKETSHLNQYAKVNTLIFSKEQMENDVKVSLTGYSANFLLHGPLKPPPAIRSSNSAGFFLFVCFNI